MGKFGTMSQIGEGEIKKQTKMSEIQIRTFENQCGGVSIFQKCLNYKLLSDPILKKKK